MSQKRSVGVTIFGWIFIVLGIFGLIGLIFTPLMRVLSSHSQFNYMRQFYGPLYLIYCGLISAIWLTVGIYVLKLKPWVRKWVIILCVWNILALFFMFIKQLQIMPAMLNSYPVPANIPAEQLVVMQSITKIIFLVSTIIGMIIGTGLWIFTIWFFNRNSIKEQFFASSAAETVKS